MFLSHLIACILYLSRSKVEGEHGDRVRVLVRNDEELAAVVELEVTGRLAASVEEAHLGERASHRVALRSLAAHSAAAALLDAEDRDGLVPAV